MRVRRAVAGALVGATLAVGGAMTVPASAQASERPAAVAEVQAKKWHTLAQYFWRSDCESAAQNLHLAHPRWVLRCHGGGTVTNWKLQRWY